MFSETYIILISQAMSLVSLMIAVYALYLQTKGNKQINKIQNQVEFTERRLMELQSEGIRQTTRIQQQIQLVDEQLAQLREITERLRELKDRLEEAESNLEQWIVAMG